MNPSICAIRLKAGGGKARSARGSTLSLVMIFGMVLLVLVAGVLTAAVHQYRMANRSLQWAQALTVAEAGIEEAVHKLAWTDDTNWAGWSVGEGGRWKEAAMLDHSGKRIGDYHVTVTSPIVRATGYVPSIANAAVKRTVRVEVFSRRPSYFNWGIYSYDTITINQWFWMDSYDSTAGPWPGRTLANSKGTIGGSTGVNLSLSQFATVNGSVQIGGTINWSTGAKVTGQAIQNSAGTPPPPFPDDELAAARMNNDNLQVKVYDTLTSALVGGVTGTVLGEGKANRRIVMPPGTYYLTQLWLGQACTIQIVPPGPVMVYIDPPDPSAVGFQLGQNNVINGNGLTNNPHYFQVYQKQGKVDLHQNLLMYGAIYAPNSPVIQAQDASLFGAVVCDGISIAKMHDPTPLEGYHYDESLGRTVPAQSAMVKSWVEVPPPR